MTPDEKKHAAMTVLAAIAAGAASAILFLLSARGTYAAMALSWFSPLPLMVAALGYGLAAGGGAAVVAFTVVAALGNPLMALAATGAFVLPAYLVCVAATAPPEDAPGRISRVSRVLTVCAIGAALSAAALVAGLAASDGGFGKARAELVAEVLPLVASVLEGAKLPAGVTSHDIARALVAAMPAAMAASAMMMLAGNVWIAGRVARISGQLSSAWPDIPETLALPGFCGILFAIACGLVFLGGLPGAYASVAASALGMGFALQGLAVIHMLTRGASLRGFILSIVYVLVVCLPPWPFAILAILGLVDAAFHLRRKRIEKLQIKT